MQRMMIGVAALVVALAPTMAFSQAQNEATIVSSEEIQTVAVNPGRRSGNQDSRHGQVQPRRRRAATWSDQAGRAHGAINHAKLTEVYYVTSGEGTIVTGSDVENVRPLAADSELVTTVVGPGNNATFKKPAQSRKVKAGDVIIIPAGLYHGFSEVPDHIEYVLVRPDVEKVLPAGYVNPALKK